MNNTQKAANDLHIPAKFNDTVTLVFILRNVYGLQLWLLEINGQDALLNKTIPITLSQ